MRTPATARRVRRPASGHDRTRGSAIRSRRGASRAPARGRRAAGADRTCRDSARAPTAPPGSRPRAFPSPPRRRAEPQGVAAPQTSTHRGSRNCSLVCSSACNLPWSESQGHCPSFDVDGISRRAPCGRVRIRRTNQRGPDREFPARHPQCDTPSPRPSKAPPDVAPSVPTSLSGTARVKCSPA